MKHFVNDHEVRSNFRDFIKQDLLPALGTDRYTYQRGDKMELACEIKGKRPKLISPSNDKMTTVRELCGLFDQTASNNEYAIFVIIRREVDQKPGVNQKPGKKPGKKPALLTPKIKQEPVSPPANELPSSPLPSPSFLFRGGGILPQVAESSQVAESQEIKAESEPLQRKRSQPSEESSPPARRTRAKRGAQEIKEA